MRKLVCAQAGACKAFVERDATIAQHFRQGLRIGAIGARFIGCHSARRSVERIEAAVFGIDKRQPARKRAALNRERISARRIQDKHTRVDRQSGQGMGKIRDTNRFAWNIRVALQTCIDGDEVVFTREL
jgi:hypothetical protein